MYACMYACMYVCIYIYIHTVCKKIDSAIFIYMYIYIYIYIYMGTMMIEHDHMRFESIFTQTQACFLICSFVDQTRVVFLNVAKIVCTQDCN